MPAERFYVVTYDIRDPKRLRRVAKAMEDFGKRVQYSVFETNLTDASLKRMRARVEGLMDEADALRIYRLCAECKEAIVVHGGPDPAKDPRYWLF